MKLTADEMRIEANFRYHERIALLCFDGAATEQEKAIARADAQTWLTNYRKENENAN